MINRTLQQAADRFNAGRYAEAEALCEQVLKRAPRHPDALRMLGLLRLREGRALEAIPLLRLTLEADSRNVDALNVLGLALLSAEQYAEAEPVLLRQIALGGPDPVAQMRLGIALAAQRRWDEALPVFEQAASGAPDQPDTHYNLGRALVELKRFSEAISRLKQTLAIDSRHVDAHNALGNALQSSGDHESAVASYRRAVELDGGHALAHHNLGNALLERGELEAASRSFREAIAAKPDYLKALSSLGVTLHEQGLWREAIASYEAALAQDAEFADAQYNLSQVHLFRGDYERAWPLYERRVDCEGIRSRLRKQAGTVALFETVPRWGGLADTAGVGIWAEQGIGDQLLFSTLIPELIGAGVSFVYEVDGRLKDAYERAFPGQQFVALSDPPQAALARAPRALWAGSLPGVFRRRREDFARQPQRLLGALPQRVAQYRSRMDEHGAGLKVALSWRSSREDRLGPRKSTRLAEFAPLLQRPGVQFVDVQYGDTAAERAALEQETGVKLLHFDEVDYFNDLEGMLAIIEACDLVITTSNVNAHLAGALGKRTWLLYLEDRPPFHYWTHTQDDRSPWYPSVRIITRADLADWPSAISHTADVWRQSGPGLSA